MIRDDIVLTKNFTLREFLCKCGKCKITDDIFSNIKKVASLLQSVRDEVNYPIFITSGYRCPDYNRVIGGVEGSAHTKGLAVDVKVDNSFYRYLLLKSALKYFPRVGIYSNFIHLDVDYSKPYPLVFLGGGKNDNS